jgi:hypothetical protein
MASRTALAKLEARESREERREVLGIGCQYYGYPAAEKALTSGWGGGALTEISA